MLFGKIHRYAKPQPPTSTPEATREDLRYLYRVKTRPLASNRLSSTHPAPLHALQSPRRAFPGSPKTQSVPIIHTTQPKNQVRSSVTATKRSFKFVRAKAFHLYRLARYFRKKRPRLFATGLGFILVIAIFGGLGLGLASNQPEEVKAVKIPSPSAAPRPEALKRGTPPYSTLEPQNKNIQELGGWTQISPPDRNPVYAYVDKIGAVQIDVSQQPLPANLKTDRAKQIEQLAQGFNATEKVTATGTTAYIGTSAQGPQSVIFTKSNLLILIKSSSPIASSDWIRYIDSLE